MLNYIRARRGGMTGNKRWMVTGLKKYDGFAEGDDGYAK